MTRAILCTLCAVLLTACNNPRPATSANSPSATPTKQSSDPQPDLGRPRESPHQTSRRSRPSANTQPGNFDFYLLTLSWSPEFCATHSSSPECPAHPGFVVHGLWPQNDDGTYPENCSTAPGPSNPQQYTNLLPTASLVQHEWATHGTCSGLAPDAYFGEIATAFHKLRIPAEFTGSNQPASLTPAAIITDFAAANPGLPQAGIAISCGRNYLTAVEVCLSKTLQPEACRSVHTCGATVVKVTPR